MTETINCVCGYKKISERGQRAKCNPVDDAMDKSLKLCVSESDYDWESSDDDVEQGRLSLCHI